MRILIVCYANPPENASGGVMSRELAADLTSMGHEVTLLTGFPNHPEGVLYPGWERSWRMVEQTTPFRLVRSWHVITRSKRVVQRSLFYLSFAVTTFLNGLFLGPFDLIYCDSTPIFGAVSCWLLAVVKRATHIYSIFDMYPEAIIDAGLLSPGWITRLLMAADTLVCRYSERTMVISEGLRQRLLERGLAAEKTVVLPMWVDVGEMRLLPRVNAWRQEQQIPDSAFVALYAGTVGLVQGAHIIIEAAERLTDDPGVLFVLVAQGLTRPELEQMTRDRGLTNVRFLDYQPRERLAEVQATADVSLVTLLPGQGRNFLPSKVLAYMAASRPIVASVDPESDTALLIEQAQCGSVAPAGDPNALADAIRTLHSDPGRAAALGAQGHTYFLERHSREAATRIYEALFRQVVAERRRKPPAQSGTPEAPPNT